MLILYNYTLLLYNNRLPMASLSLVVAFRYAVRVHIDIGIIICVSIDIDSNGIVIVIRKFVAISDIDGSYLRHRCSIHLLE